MQHLIILFPSKHPTISMYTKEKWYIDLMLDDIRDSKMKFCYRKLNLALKERHDFQDRELVGGEGGNVTRNFEEFKVQKAWSCSTFVFPPFKSCYSFVLFYK